MLDPSQRNEIQWVDPKLNMVYPWYTKPFLEVLETWDLSDKTILEYGGGFSSLWFAKKAKRVVTVECDKKWISEIEETAKHLGLTNLTLIHSDVDEGDQVRKWEYTDCIDHLDLMPDIVCVDGILRNECLQKGVEMLSRNGGIIIADNIYQDFVWLSQWSLDYMKPFEQYIYIQPDHTNHEGNPWKSGYYIIPKDYERNLERY